jgi:ketosteroid isomerase-like protein
MAPPETYYSGQTWSSDVREVVERFYDALRRGDTDAIDELVEERFAPDVVARQPESLPFGGVYEGIDAVKRLFAALGAPDAPVDVERLAVEEIIESVGEPDRVDHVVVAVSFPLPGAEVADPGRWHALEWWTFRELRVAELRTFYWDTAAYVGPQRTRSPRP